MQLIERPFVSVSLATISGRVGKVHRTLESLLGQDYPAFDVNLYISRESFLLDEGIVELPGSLTLLRDHYPGKLTFYEVPNTGSYRKLLPWLASHPNCHGLVATADDDTLYPREWLSGLVDAYEEHRCIVCYRGHRMVCNGKGFAEYRQWMRSRPKVNPSIHNLPTGKDGVLYHTAHFHASVADVQMALDVAPTADDLWFKWHTAANGVEVFCLNDDYASQSFPDTGSGGDNLYDKFNRGGRNDESVARLQRYGTSRLGLDLANYDPAEALTPHRAPTGPDDQP